ncbi:MAG: hypothetical protein PHD37_05045 [Gallionellaceae bacterium]|nr:hypothetical protein [Gallionellaceae bacterium]
MTENLDPGTAQITVDPWAVPPVDWDKWGKERTARLWQVAALFCNVPPESIENSFFPGKLDTLFHRVPLNVTELIGLAKAAIGSRALRVKSLDDNALEDSEVDLTAFATWACDVGKGFPPEFPRVIPEKRVSVVDEPLRTRERTTLLTLIAALANEAGIDISKPSKAAGLIEGLTLRIDARIAARTIEDHLKRIPEALEKKQSA